jgi:hypothetical protein
MRRTTTSSASISNLSKREKLTLAFFPSPSAPKAPSLRALVHLTSFPSSCQLIGSLSQYPSPSAQNMYRGLERSTTSFSGVAGSASWMGVAVNDLERSCRLGGGEFRSKRSSPWNGVGRAGCRAAASSDSASDVDTIG